MTSAITNDLSISTIFNWMKPVLSHESVYKVQPYDAKIHSSPILFPMRPDYVTASMQAQRSTLYRSSPAAILVIMDMHIYIFSNSFLLCANYCIFLLCLLKSIKVKAKYNSYCRLLCSKVLTYLYKA